MNSGETNPHAILRAVPAGRPAARSRFESDAFMIRDHPWDPWLN
jgi:hypothetical protein